MKSLNIIISLLLPAVAVLFIGYTLNHYWQITIVAMAIFTFSVALSASTFNKNFIYRLVVSSIGFIISLQLAHIWPAVQVLFSVLWAACFAHSLNFVKWGKYFWLIIPLAVVRVVTLWLTIMSPLLPDSFNFTSGDSLDKNVFGLFMFTFSVIMVLLTVDVIVYLLKRLYLEHDA